MTDFVWVGSLSKVALFFLSAINKDELVRNYALRLSETGFFTEFAGHKASYRKKKPISGPHA
jgi:hypothetical protein